MTDSLHPDEFVDLAPTEPGTVHKHHCKQGRNNDRMYITREEDGTILAYCHHCGRGGRHSVLGNRILQTSKDRQETDSAQVPTGDELHNAASGTDGPGHSKSDTGGRSVPVQSEFVPRGNSEANTANWPAHVKKWWFEYGLTVSQAAPDAACAFYWPEEDAISYTHLGGWQYRFFGKDAPLKYRSKPDIGNLGNSFFTTYALEGPKPLLVADHNNHVPLVLVEDFRSALKLSNYCCALAIGSTNMSEELVAKFIEEIPTESPVIVWLDNDNQQVITASSKLQGRFIALGYRTYRVTSAVCTKDPKEVSWQDIYEILTGTLNGT